MKAKTKTQAHRSKEQPGCCQRQRSEGEGEMGDTGQKVQTSSSKINKSWRYNVQHTIYSITGYS